MAPVALSDGAGAYRGVRLPACPLTFSHYMQPMTTQPVSIPKKATKYELALLLILTKAQNSGDRILSQSHREQKARQDAEYIGKHNTLPGILAEIKKYNLSLDGNNPYRYNAVVNAYAGRVGEFFNLSTDARRKLDTFSRDFYSHYTAGLLEEQDVKPAIRRLKSQLRKLLPALIALPCRSYFWHKSRSTNYLAKHQELQSEYEQCSNLLDSVVKYFATAVYDECEAMEKKLRERMRELCDKSATLARLYAIGPMAYAVAEASNGISSQSEMTRDERNQVQRAIAEGLIVRKESTYELAGVSQ